MKLQRLRPTQQYEQVTLCVRVWIEIGKLLKSPNIGSVTLCVRVWIEIHYKILTTTRINSHPLREGVD